MSRWVTIPAILAVGALGGFVAAVWRSQDWIEQGGMHNHATLPPGWALGPHD
jgi:hypothetical protein